MPNGKLSFQDYIDSLVMGLMLNRLSARPVKVIFNPPATIVLWSDKDKTVVKCREGEEFDEWIGFITAYAKKAYGKGFVPFVRRQLKNAIRQEKKDAGKD